MVKAFVTYWFLFFSFLTLAQGQWVFSELRNMPKPTTNNILMRVELGDNNYVYSFGGVSDSLAPAGIHKSTYKYDVIQNNWSKGLDIPDTLGKLNAKATFLNNRIYIIGGAYIDTANNYKRITSNKVHVYNPFIDTFEIDAAKLPTPVENQVQLAWKDSLIYVISGRSGDINTPKVQIYNPAFDSWQKGTSLPDNDYFRARGASGYISGDTIFYFGGASGQLISKTEGYLRKGLINSDNPSEIVWSLEDDKNDYRAYRPVVSGHKNTIFWFGGTKEEFNLKGKDVDSNRVKPLSQIVNYNLSNSSLSGSVTAYSGMDLGGIAKLGGGNWLVAGGIDSLGHISNRTLLMNNKSLSDIEDATQPPSFIIVEFDEYYLIKTENIGTVDVYDITGRNIFNSQKSLADLVVLKSDLKSNILIFVYNDGSNVPVTQKRILIK